MTVIAIVPALDEEGNIGDVVRGIACHVERVIVVDNGSADATGRIAHEAGAEVVVEPRRGYGRACLAGLSRARAMGATTVVFLDADGSDDPAQAPLLLGPVLSGGCDLALGRRDPARTEAGAMTPAQRFGNWFAPLLMRLTMGAPYRDMPPFKACTMAALERLELADVGHGFTIELLVKAHLRGLSVIEVDVSCRARRAGESKVSGTVRGSVRAGGKILTTIARHGSGAWLDARRRRAL